MPRRVKIVGHVSEANLEALYREERERVKRSHYQVVLLLMKGYQSEAVKEVSGYSLPWIRTIAKRYNQEGPSGLGDKRLKAPGGHFILDETHQRELYEALLKAHPQEGLWNSRLVAEWIYAKTGRKIHAQRGWEYLKRLGFSLKRPRPRHRQADAREQADFEKSSSWSPS